MSNVTGFTSGLMSSGTLLWHAATLDCGHTASIELKPSKYVCIGCGKKFSLAQGEQHTRCVCGKFVSSLLWYPDASKESDRLTKVGDYIPCKECETIKNQVKWIESLDPKRVHHIRFRPHFGGTYTFYRLDRTSPSNFSSIGGCYANSETDAAIARMKFVAPISPTESA